MTAPTATQRTGLGTTWCLNSVVLFSRRRKRAEEDGYLLGWAAHGATTIQAIWRIWNQLTNPRGVLGWLGRSSKLKPRHAHAASNRWTRSMRFKKGIQCPCWYTTHLLGVLDYCWHITWYITAYLEFSMIAGRAVDSKNLDCGDVLSE